MGEPKKLSRSREAWLRHHIPAWGDLRDRAVASGLIEPEAPDLTRAQAEVIAEVRERVLASLNPANSNKE